MYLADMNIKELNEELVKIRNEKKRIVRILKKDKTISKNKKALTLIEEVEEDNIKEYYRNTIREVKKYIELRNYEQDIIKVIDNKNKGIVSKRISKVKTIKPIGKVSDAQRRATEKWDAKNPDVKKKSRAKSGAKIYIRDFADELELKEIEKLIKERKEELQTA